MSGRLLSIPIYKRKTKTLFEQTNDNMKMYKHEYSSGEAAAKTQVKESKEELRVNRLSSRSTIKDLKREQKKNRN